MIKSTNDSIEIYTKKYKDGVLYMLTVCFSILSIIIFLESAFVRVKLWFAIINIILILSCLYIHSKNQNILELKVTKEYIQINQLKPIIINTDNIEKVVPYRVNTSEVLPDSLLIIFKKTLGKEPYVHLVKASINIIDFANIVNNFLKSSNDRETGSNIFCFIGKKHFVSSQSYVTFLFANESKKLLDLPFNLLSKSDIDKLKCNSCYIINFEKNTNLLSLTPSHKQIDLNIIEDLKNDITIKYNFWFNDDIIQKESEFKYKILKQDKLFRTIIIFLFFIIFILFFINIWMSTFSFIFSLFFYPIYAYRQNRKIYVTHENFKKLV